MKIIPAIDLIEGNVVRLVKGDPKNKIIYSNDPVDVAKKFQDEGADMLHIVDLDAALSTGWNDNKNNEYIVSKILNSVHIPIQASGGLRSVDLINNMLKKGAKKIIVGTMAYKDPKTIRQLSIDNPRKIIVSIDQINDMVMIDGWKKPSGFRVTEAIKLFMLNGIHEFLLTSVDRDGTLSGPNLSMLLYAVNIPNTKIIASGGISNISDIIKVKNIGCSSVILGKALYDGKISIKQAKAVA
ncbi:MAG: 1-(5-phosphoribosyl)-5-[(5-phosphoribosylamino)methylideneamino]imidazole-4-carboxamide isomerase [Nitrososphaeraceae archaeon]|nr:1-(5-phosphoribosyl)-5-[(5-phosphoribosylamino)methylideneamino]imidazole-4-carboxamide isomerase [Nitrososphaeraceae archaeon]